MVGVPDFGVRDAPKAILAFVFGHIVKMKKRDPWWLARLRCTLHGTCYHVKHVDTWRKPTVGQCKLYLHGRISKSYDKALVGLKLIGIFRQNKLPPLRVLEVLVHPRLQTGGRSPQGPQDVHVEKLLRSCLPLPLGSCTSDRASLAPQRAVYCRAVSAIVACLSSVL